MTTSASQPGTAADTDTAGTDDTANPHYREVYRRVARYPEADVPIQPEPYAMGGGSRDYPARCADIDGAMQGARDWVANWDRLANSPGWWHDRPTLIALHNEVIRLRRLLDVAHYQGKR